MVEKLGILLSQINKWVENSGNGFIHFFPLKIWISMLVSLVLD